MIFMTGWLQNRGTRQHVDRLTVSMTVAALHMTFFALFVAVTAVNDDFLAVDDFLEWKPWLFRSVANSELAQLTDHVVATFAFLDKHAAFGAKHRLKFT